MTKYPEAPSALVIRTAVECSGFRCDCYTSISSLMRSARRDEHAAIVLDDGSGIEAARDMVKCRGDWLDCHVALLVFGPDSPAEAARYLDEGVDDYLRLPVNGVELVARLRAALRKRSARETRVEPSVAGCRLDRASSSLVSSGKRVHLTSRELGVASLLFENPGCLLSRERLAQDVWAMSPELSKRTLEQHIYQLRRKLRQCVGEAVVLRGVYGSGYRIEVGSVDLAPEAQPPKSRPSPKLRAVA